MKNRPLKFRAYDTKEKKWLFDYPTLGGFSMFGELHIMDELHIEQLPNIAVMQFTGTSDKNGKEVYEGDVVQVPDKKYLKIIIEWGHEECYQGVAYGFNCHKEMGDYEIIGNVWDNPSLLT